MAIGSVVLSTAVPFSSGAVPKSNPVIASVKSTVPSGVPASKVWSETMAVNVTRWPYWTDAALAVTVVLVVACTAKGPGSVPVPEAKSASFT
jgi:hypothetical protein